MKEEKSKIEFSALSKNEKKEWERQRDAELIRIKEAGDRLAEGWKELEAAKRKWMDEQSE